CCACGSADRRLLLPFPTRRSSDLGLLGTARLAGLRVDAPDPAEEERQHHVADAEQERQDEQSARRVPASTSGKNQRERHRRTARDRKSTRLNSSHLVISNAVFCLK